MIKKIVFVIFSSANYNSIKSVIQNILKKKIFKVKIILGASALSDKYGNVDKRLKNDGIKIDYKIETQLDKTDKIAMVKTTGLNLIELSDILNKVNPDLVFTIGDRHETISTAIAASYMNILVAHTMGGEVSGTIDETVRHSITKLSNFHFVSNEDAKKRVIALGEKKENVFNVGCPRNDIIKNIINHKEKYEKKAFEFLSSTGVGDYSKISSKDNYVVVLFHPDTQYILDSAKTVKNILLALEKMKKKSVIIWPNSDAGSDLISKKIRILREKKILKDYKIVKNLPIEIYIPLLLNSEVLIGNSSSGLRDGSFLGVPAINIGSRQKFRLKGKNVLDISVGTTENIIRAIKKHSKKRFKRSSIYGTGDSAKKIVNILKKLKKTNTSKTITF